MQPARNTLSLLAVACGLSGFACANTGSPIQISDFLAVSSGPVGTATGCTTTSDSIVSSTVYTGGSFVAFKGGLEVTNQMIEAREQGTDPMRVPQLTLYLDTITTSYKFTPDQSDQGGAVTLKPETTTVFAVIKTSESAQFPGQLLGVDNGSLLLGRSGTLKINVTVSGKTVEGSRVTSPTVEMPVRLSASAPPCPDGQAIDTRNSCNPSQAGAYVCK